MKQYSFKEWGADDGKHCMAWRQEIKEVRLLIKICGQ